MTRKTRLLTLTLAFGLSVSAEAQTSRSVTEGAMGDSLRISYYYSGIHDAPVTTWLGFGQTFTIFDGGACDIARCGVSLDGRLAAFYRDCAGTSSGTLGPWVTFGCSTAEEAGYTVQCCVLPLGLSKVGSHTVVESPGTVVTYTYTVTNYGSTTLTSVEVLDDPLGSVTLSDVAGDGPSLLAPGDSESGTLHYTVTLEDVIDGSPITNTATASSDQSDPVVEAWTVDIAPPALTFAMSADYQVVQKAGTVVTYSYEVANFSGVTLTNVVVVDDLLGPVQLSDAAEDGAGVIAPGGAESGTLYYTITSNDVDSAMPIRTQATATSDQTVPATDEWTVWFSSPYLTEVDRLQAQDPKASDHFGTSVAVVGDRTIVGAPQVSGAAGAAYIFERSSGGDWMQAAVLQPTDGTTGDNFGARVALGTDRALVGASGLHSAYVFERTVDGLWPQVAKLEAGTGAITSVALSGDRAIVGAADAADQFRGSVFEFERTQTGTWAMTGQLRGSGSTSPYSNFGGSVATEAERLVVGATGEDDYRGAAYVFERDGGGRWSEAARLQASDRGPQELFGAAVALSGDVAVIGCPGKHGAYVVHRGENGAWTEVGKLRQAVTASFRLGGAAVFDGQRAFVGGALYGTQAVYMFENDGAGGWTEIGSLLPGLIEDESGFGGSVSMSGDRIVVGASGRDLGAADAGVVYVFEAVEVGIDDVRDTIPQEYTLLHNYPNPVSGTTTISYSIPRPAVVRLSVMDLLGRVVGAVASGSMPAGTHELVFDASGLTSGVYFYRLEAGDFVSTKKLLVVR